MSSYIRLDVDLRWCAVGRIEDGMSQAEVARNLNASRMVISRQWKQFQTMGTVVRHGHDRPKATIPKEDLYLTVNEHRDKNTETKCCSMLLSMER
ncbi:hypothetical protein TNCV_3772821 [Trichonephila clavipes]|nr:hypothetical protein TNCV_3772821 [Trichonephila clavipes]